MSWPPRLAIESTHSVAPPHGWFQPGRVGPTFLLKPVRSVSVALKPPSPMTYLPSRIDGRRLRMVEQRSFSTPLSTTHPSLISLPITLGVLWISGQSDRQRSVRETTFRMCWCLKIADQKWAQQLLTPTDRSMRSTLCRRLLRPNIPLRRKQHSMPRQTKSWLRPMVSGRHGFLSLRRGHMSSCSHLQTMSPTSHR